MNNTAHILHSSPLWASAAKVQPKGIAWPKNDSCVMCGAPIPAGHLAVAADRALFDDTFNNRTDCRHEGGAACGHCNALWDSKWMQKNSKSYAVQGQVVFSLSNNPDIAAFVLTPPESAYVAIFNTRQQAHMIWRTPVALPSPYLQVRADDDVMVIDRDRVMRGAVAWQKCMEILRAVGLPKSTPYPLKPAYKMDSFMLGHPFARNVLAIENHSAEGARALRTLEELSMADWWALNALRDVDMTKPSTWPRRRTIEQAEKDRADKKAHE